MKIIKNKGNIVRLSSLILFAAYNPVMGSVIRGDSPVGSGTLFNPEISVILDYTYGLFEEGIGEPEGFELAHDHSHGHDHGVSEGFSLREAEITFAGALDPYFDMMLMLAVSDHGIEVEEGYITSRSLPAGLGLKMGKFMSDTGYVNKAHPHDWLFVDQPWVNEFLLGEEGIVETGVQLTWLPPTNAYTRLGVEVLEGVTEGIAPYVGEKRHQIVTITPETGSNDPERNRWRADMGFEEVNGPRLFNLFMNWAPDLGFDHAARLGVWGAHGRAFQVYDAHSSGRLETWDGNSLTAGADLVYKYNGQGVMGHRNLVLQGEYIFRRLDLRYREKEFSGVNNGVLIEQQNNKQIWEQDGLYLQGVYGFLPRWNAGLRLDLLGLTNKGFEEGGGALDEDGISRRYSAQVSFAPTEFSRFRLQGSYDDPYGETPGWKLMLQYNVSLGVHGAHSF